MKSFIIVFLVLTAFSFIACKTDKTDDKKEVTVTFKPKVESTSDTTVYLGNYEETEIEQLIFVLGKLSNSLEVKIHSVTDVHQKDSVKDSRILGIVNQKIGENLEIRSTENIFYREYIVEDKKSESTTTVDFFSNLYFITDNKKYIMQYYFNEMSIIDKNSETYTYNKRSRIIQGYPSELIFKIEKDENKIINKHISESDVDVLYKKLVSYLLQYNIIIDYTDVYYNNEKTDKQALYLKISKDDFSELIPKTDIKSDEMVDYDREEFERIFNEEMERLKEKEKSD